MSSASDQSLLEVLLDSWDRNNTILINLLRALPEGGLAVRAVGGSPTVAELFTHIHYVRLVFVSEDAPEFGRNVPEQEWLAERDPSRIAQMLNESAKTVRDAVKNRAETGREMNLHYDHPILMLQHMIWHEGYHHGQISWRSRQRAVRSAISKPDRSLGACGCRRSPHDSNHARFRDGVE